MSAAAPLPTVIAIARAEARLLLRRRSTGALLALFAALLVAAAVLASLRATRERAQQDAYRALVRAQWEQQPDRHPHRVAHYGTFAFMPVGPLAAFDPGVQSYVGRVQFLEAHRQNAANFPEAAALSSAFRLGELSPAFVLHVLLPLVVIVLGHRLIADEAESGRLRLLLSQPVGPRALLAGKLLGLALALLPFAAVAALASGFVVLTAGGGVPDSLPRLALLALLAAAHLAGWMLVTLLVSVRLASPGRALAALVTAWAAAVVVVPRAAGALAAAADPLPTRTEFDARLAAEVHALGDAHNPDDPVFTQLRRDTLARHGVTRVEELPVNYGAVVMARGEELTAGTFARHFEALVGRMERQEAGVRRAALLAPTLGVRALSAAVSGTDLRAALRFQREAEAYRYAFVQQLNALHRDKIRFENDRGQRLSAAHWAEFSDFQPSVAGLREALAGTAWCWLALALWIVVPGVALAWQEVRP